MTNPWLDPEIAHQQRALVDEQLQQFSASLTTGFGPHTAHFTAFAEAVRATQCPGDVLEVGCGVGHGREILDRAGVEYRSYSGFDISHAAIALAKERYPESLWLTGDFGAVDDGPGLSGLSLKSRYDIVVDGSCLLHVEDWRAHLAALCKASRRWVILHRAPVAGETARTETHGYGHTFPAWRFDTNDLIAEMRTHGLILVGARHADGDSSTWTFARPRHFATYCDHNYLPRLKALHASMVRHCGVFSLHVLAWDDDGTNSEVASWCALNKINFQTSTGFLAEHPELALGKLPGPPRTKVEHFWTCGPAWSSAIMEHTQEPVTYLDADCFLHSSPEPVFAEIGGAPAAVVPHAFARAAQGLPGPTRETHESPFGRFNVGLVYAAEVAFPKWWAERCREWCYDRVEGFKDSRLGLGCMEQYTRYQYGDQFYLNRWAEGPPYFEPTPGPKWPSGPAHVIQHPGAAPGPWCVHTRALDVRDGVIHFGNRPLVAWHYSSYREGPHGAEQLTRPEYAISERQAELLYRPYIQSLRESK